MCVCACVRDDRHFDNNHSRETSLSHTYMNKNLFNDVQAIDYMQNSSVFFCFYCEKNRVFLVADFFIHFCVSFAATANSVSIELPWIHWGIFVWILCFFFSAALLRWKMCSHKRNNRVWNESPIKIGIFFFVRSNCSQAGEKKNKCWKPITCIEKKKKKMLPWMWYLRKIFTYFAQRTDGGEGERERLIES